MKLTTTILGMLALLAIGFAAGDITSQSATMGQLGKEHEWLGTLAGEYSATMRGLMGDTPASARIESTLGGLWSIRHFESTVMGQPYTGIEVLGYDPLKEKFVSVWADSMTPLLITLEGDYDAESRTLTMRGLSRGMDGEEAEMVNTTELNDGGMLFTMNIEGNAAPIVTVDYERKR